VEYWSNAKEQLGVTRCGTVGSLFIELLGSLRW